MPCRTGTKESRMNVKKSLKRLLLGPEDEAIPVLGRNDRCWCGSGKKYKTCHLASDDRKRAAQRSAVGATR
jgi:uncharacterized protein YecA (UPF0149 family)